MGDYDEINLGKILYFVKGMDYSWNKEKRDA
jgi:hypothetical protein